MYKHCN